jgi:hypothetical protein
VAGLVLLYTVCAAILFYLLPDPHQDFEYMVIGTASAGLTMAALFVGAIFYSRC